MKTTLSGLFFIFIISLSFAQNKDSLYQIIKSSTAADSDKFKAYLELMEHRYNYDSIYLAYIISAEKIAKKKQIREFYLGRLYINKGMYLYFTDKYDSARSVLTQACKIFENKGNLHYLASCYGNLGNTYCLQGNFIECMQYLLKAQDYIYKLGDSVFISVGENNIGNVYFSLGDTAKALEHYKKAYYISKSIEKKSLMALAANNIASTVSNPDTALYYYSLAIKYATESNYYKTLADAYLNSSKLYLYKHQFDSAYLHIKTSLDIYQKYNIPSGLARGYARLGLFYQKIKIFDSSYYYFQKAIEIADSIGSKEILRDAYYGLFEVDSLIARYKSALKNYILYIKYKDSISQTKVQEDIANLQAKYDLRLQEQENKLLKEKQKQQALLIKRQKLIIMMSVIISIVLLAFFVVLFRSSKIIKKKNEKLEKMNTEILKKNNLLNNQKKEIIVQKEEIEAQRDILIRQQKDINESLRYASDLQRILFPDLSILDRYFKEWFIFYKPRDIVSGDFYWLKQINEDKIFIIVGDCTGHGIPGAIMSVMTITLLNETFSYKNDNITAAKALEIGRKKIKKTFLSEPSALSYDGLDAAVIIYDKKNKIVNFAGAMRPIYIVNNEKFIIQKGDRMPIAAYIDEKPFSDYFFNVSEGDMIYLFTDGFPDLFSPDFKKFTIKRFKNHITGIHKFPANVQKDKLIQIFKQWKKDSKQIDDIITLGLRI